MTVMNIDLSKQAEEFQAYCTVISELIRTVEKEGMTSFECSCVFCSRIITFQFTGMDEI